MSFDVLRNGIAMDKVSSQLVSNWVEVVVFLLELR